MKAAPAMAVTLLTCAVLPLAIPGSAPRRLIYHSAAGAFHPPFVLNNSATADKFQIETMAGGLGIIDYNNDGQPDVYFANGARLPAMRKDSPAFWNRLYRNDGNGIFRDVTATANVAGRGFCTGVAIGDYDNDGWQDVFVACRPANLLYRNRGNGTFEEAAARAGVKQVKLGGESLWTLAAGWFDADNDGHLDLFLANYCDWSAENNPYCGNQARGQRIYCDPRQFRGQPNTLLRNRGDGTFADISASGIGSVHGYGMGVSFADANRDGLLDVFVANDTVRHQFYENRGAGRFVENALFAGLSHNLDGREVSGMGSDFRDLDNDGRPDVFVTALATETWPLFHNRGTSGFEEVIYRSQTGRYSVGMSGWSNAIADLDNDGWKDLIAVRSHVFDNADVVIRKPYREPLAFFRNLGGMRFEHSSDKAGEALRTALARRGLAVVDVNGDGALDLITSAIGAPAELLISELEPRANWVRFRLEGSRSNRDGIGAMVEITDASGRSQFNHSSTSVGYACSGPREVHFGLGNYRGPVRTRILWPAGDEQVLEAVTGNKVVHIKEPN